MSQTLRLQPDAGGIVRAAELLRKGALVAFPTETVYGLGGDATRDASVLRIFEAKRRPRRNPLILHVPDLAAARLLGQFDDVAERLAQAFWPGPLTLVLPRQPRAPVADIATGGLSTIAIRVPDQPLAQKLLRAVDRPIAAPSANPSGRISPTTADHVMAGLGGRIAAVLDGGPCPVGLESSIVLTGPEPRLLRPGGIASERLEECAGVPLPVHAGPVNAPGQLASHYAPRNRLRLNAPMAARDERLLGFGDMPCDLNLSATGDLAEAAANLFSCLHKLDEREGPVAVAPIPDTGLGRAINDRLRRAAAPRR